MNTIEESKRLKNKFLDSISAHRKTALITGAQKISLHVEGTWKTFGHQPKWAGNPSIETNRNINYPKDESLYARRNATCENCKFDMWFMVHEGEIIIHGGTHQCPK